MKCLDFLGKIILDRTAAIVRAVQQTSSPSTPSISLPSVVPAPTPVPVPVPSQSSQAVSSAVSRPQVMSIKPVNVSVSQPSPTVNVSIVQKTPVTVIRTQVNAVQVNPVQLAVSPGSTTPRSAGIVDNRTPGVSTPAGVSSTSGTAQLRKMVRDPVGSKQELVTQSSTPRQPQQVRSVDHMTSLIMNYPKLHILPPPLSYPYRRSLLAHLTHSSMHSSAVCRLLVRPLPRAATVGTLSRGPRCPTRLQRRC